MNNFWEKVVIATKIVLGSILVVAAILVISWLPTCGIIKLITMCFGLEFKWSVATGIWIILCLLEALFFACAERISKR